MGPGIAPATIIVDRGRRILRANAEGASQLKRGEIVEAVGGRVQMCLRGLQVEMDRALKDGNETPILLPLGATVNRRTAIGIVPIKRHSNGERRFARVFQEARASSPLAMEIWSKTYSLTGGELRLLHGLVLGSEPREIAESYSIALSTVRTHLLSLFRKTGARRQSDPLARGRRKRMSWRRRPGAFALRRQGMMCTHV